MRNNKFLVGLTWNYQEVKRLGYVREVAEILKPHSLATDQIALRLENKAKELNDLLDQYVEPVGKIKSGTGKKHATAKNHLQVTGSMDWVKNIVASRWIITKYGKVLCNLPRNVNPFTLTRHEQCVFLRKLLLRDTDYFISILSSIPTELDKFNSVIHIGNGARKMLGEKLDILLQKARFVSVRNAIKKRMREIKTWEKRNVLMHRLRCRLSWGIDLNLVKQEHGAFVLTDEGEKLLESVKSLSEMYFPPDINPSWLENTYFHVFSTLFFRKVKNWADLDEDEKLRYTLHYLHSLFPKLANKTVARIGALTFCETTCINLLCNDNIVTSFDQIKDCLSDISKQRSHGYVYRWSHRRKDGYVFRPKA